MTNQQAEDFIRDNREAFFDGVYLSMGRPQVSVWGTNENGEECVKRSKSLYVEGQDFVSIPVLGNLGSLEVKANQQFLTQDNNDQRRTYLEQAGTLYFEVFQDWKPERRQDMMQGWMYSIIDPMTYTDLKKKNRQYWLRQGLRINEVTSERWGNFALVLLEGKGNPFACIAFQNAEVLINRLRELCPDSEGWGMYDIKRQIPATQKEYWDQYTKYWDKATNTYHNIKWDKNYGGMIEANWHIPLNKIIGIDGVKVTMIGDDPDPHNEFLIATKKASDEGRKYYGSEELITKRLNALKELSTERMYPEELKAAQEEWFAKTGKPGHFITDEQMAEIERRYGGEDKIKEYREHIAEVRNKIKAVVNGGKMLDDCNSKEKV